ncbi:DUF1295 domain-containing protein [Undibacterium sp. TJN19]|uniref:DUF1295 domain-containing protein n=1 Tax=Undibacterium sp. TJN19 TaxID=3413055 RepID=UPI003BEFBE09
MNFRGDYLTTGLYAYVRHPAYVCKNLAWWIFAGALAYQNAIAGKSYVFQLLALADWSWIYAQRAIT